MRHAIGDGCPPDCHLYIVYSTLNGLPGSELMGTIFPDSDYVDWTPVVRLGGKKQKELAQAIEDHSGPFISFKALKAKTGVNRPAKIKESLQRGHVREAKSALEQIKALTEER